MSNKKRVNELIKELDKIYNKYKDVFNEEGTGAWAIYDELIDELLQPYDDFDENEDFPTAGV